MRRLALAAAGVLLGLFARRCTDAFLDLYRNEDPEDQEFRW